MMKKLSQIALSVLCLALPMFAQQTPVSFSISSTGSPCAVIRATNNATVGIIVSGVFTGTLTPTLQIFSVSGSPTASTGVTPTPSSGSLTPSRQATITATGGYTVNIGGFTQFNLCPTAWTSGTATVQLFSTAAINIASLGIGGSTGLGSPATAPGDLYITGPSPYIDMLAFGGKGDALQFSSMGATSAATTAVTIVGSSTSKFAAGDCTGGTGCTGAVNKYLGISGGGPNAPASVPALTAAAGGSQLANVLAFKITCTMDNGTILNGESLPSAESIVAVSANQKVTTALAPTCPANTTGTSNGYRVYAISPSAVYETKVLTPGSTYTSPLLTFNAGTCTTTPVAQLITGGFGPSNGYVVGANITTPGSCTVNPTSCTISGGGGAGATATCTYTGGVLTKVTINNNGSGFTMPTIAVTGNGVTGLVATPVITGGAGAANAGTLTGVQIINPGWLCAGTASTTCSGTALTAVTTPTGTVSGGGAGVQGTFSFAFGGEILQPSSICSASTGIHATLNICDITATINLTTFPSELLGVYPPANFAPWFSTISAFNSTSSVNIADAIPVSVAGNITPGVTGTDNTTAFNNALATCPSNNNIKQVPGCTIFFPPTDNTVGSASPSGRYLFSAGAVVNLNNVFLFGGGQGTSGNAGNQAYGTALIGQNNSIVRGWTGPQPPSEIVVGSRDWAVRFGSSTEGGGAYNIAAADYVGQSAGGFFDDGGSAAAVNNDHHIFWNTLALNFSNGDCYATDSTQIIWFWNPQGSSCRNGVRFMDQTSNPQLYGGAFTGSQGINGTSQGPSYCIWGSNNANAPSAPGNIQLSYPECRDFSSGWLYTFDHAGMQVGFAKMENIAMNEGEACINQQACMGIGFRVDAFQGSALGRCVGSAIVYGNYSRTAQDFYVGNNCTATDVLFPNGMPNSANGDVAGVDNGTRSDLIMGNAGFGFIAGKLQGGTAFGIEALANNAVAIDCTKGNLHRMTYTNAGGTLTIANPTGCVDGEPVNFEITNGSGAATEGIAWGANYTNGFASLLTIPIGQVCNVLGHFNLATGHVIPDSAGTMSAGNNCH
jgi:hypothetical protein